MANFTVKNGLELSNTVIASAITDESIIENLLSGQLFSWGINDYGQIGNNLAGATKYSSPVQTVSGGTSWKVLSSGYNHTAAIKTDGTLWTWGQNYYGQLGKNNQLDYSSPVQTVALGTDWKFVCCADYRTAALKNDGTIWVWGRNEQGEFGNGTTNNYSSPILAFGGTNNWKSISLGNNLLVAMRNDGTVWMSGINYNGQFGNGTNGSNFSSPVLAIGGTTNWKSVIASHAGHVCAGIRTDGSLWLWGFGYYGVIGNDVNSNPSYSSPVQTVAGGNNWKQVIVSRGLVAHAIKNDGTLWAWGYNAVGQIGDNTRANKSSPVQTVAGGNNWKSVFCYDQHVLAIKTDGTLWTWGQNSYGQLGDASVVNKSSPVQITGAGNNWKSVSGGYRFSSALTYTDIK